MSGTAYISQNQSGGYSGVSAGYNLGYTPSVNLHEPGPNWCRQWCVRYSLSYTLSVILIYTSLDLASGDSGVSGTGYVSTNQSGGYSGVSARYNLGYTPSVNLHEPGPIWCRQWCIWYNLSYTLSVILIYTSLDLAGGES